MSPVRVLVVDDSAVIRHLITTALQSDPTIEVVAAASDGRIALDMVAQHKPDLITMDVEMPNMDGISTVRELRARGVRTPIIMCSTLTHKGAGATLEALLAGASDYIPKPSNGTDRTQVLAELRTILVGKVHALTASLTAPARPTASATAPAGGMAHQSPATPLAAPRPLTGRPSVVLIGSSTGGPQALATVLESLPSLPVPVLIVQHMPPVFTTQLAARLDRLTPGHVQEATSGQPLSAGNVYIAPGDRHLTVHGSVHTAATRLTQDPPRNFCRPSVDVLFDSAVATYGARTFAVVLTGMGSDGRDGAVKIRDAGGTVIAQDEATSVVWGMPGAVATAGAAHQILPLAQVADRITQAVTGSTP